MTESQATVCYRHPTKETGLRCNRCERPICAQCARRTPTGYRCPECIREQSRVFVTARWYDYLTSFLTASILSFLAVWLVTVVGGGFGFLFIFILFFAATAIGSLIAEAIRCVVRKRRARSLFITATAGVVVGGLLPSLPLLIGALLTGEIRILLSLLWPGIFLFLMASTVYVRLSGIQIGR